MLSSTYTPSTSSPPRGEPRLRRLPHRREPRPGAALELLFETEIESDPAPLHGLVACMLETGAVRRCLRDPTRGGLALLGFDPLYVANEGKLVAIVAAPDAGAAVERMRRHPLGTGAAVIGRVEGRHPGMVVMRTGIGGTRVVDLHPGATETLEARELSPNGWSGLRRAQ